MRGPLIFITGFFIKCLLILCGFWAISFFETRVFYQPVYIWIEKGTPSRHIAQKLVDKGLTSSLYGVIAWQKVTNISLKAGEYMFMGPLSTYDILKKISEGHVMHRHLTIPEGLKSQSILEILKDTPYLTGDLEPLAEADILPETYEYTRGEHRTTLLNRMKAAQKAFLESLPRSFSSFLTSWHQVLTLASIVEKETRLVHEMPHIAGVFLHRLKLGIPLQSDPTVLYGLAIQGREPYKTELQQDHPYNTYTRSGLPIGPICAPGKAAIEAVLSPLETKDLYFVADGTGGHIFSQTLKDHQKNHTQWRLLRLKNQGKAKTSPSP